MKKFLAIALILAAAGCARKEAGPVRYDRMELIYHHYEFAQDPREFARNAVDVIRKSKRKTTIYRTANITGQDTLSFISSRIYSAEADTLPSQSPYIKMVALLHNEDRTDTLSSEMWIGDPFLFNGTAIILGYDNRMGSDSIPPQEVASVAESLGLDVIRTDMVEGMPGTAVSSTRIRALISSGDVSDAAAMLGYDYSLYGVVVAGNRIGRTMGFPTANMQLYEPLKLIPGNGVYSVKVQTLGKEWKGMCNIGNRPTVGAGNACTVETNIFGFDEDIYGLDMKVTFIRKIREEIRFASLEALKNQLQKDRQLCLMSDF